MVMGGASGGGGGTVVSNAPTITNPDKVSNSDAASAIAAAKGQVANDTQNPAVTTTAPNGQAAQTATQQTATTADGKVPTAADAILSISANTPVKQVLLKNTLGAGQAL